MIAFDEATKRSSIDKVARGGEKHYLRSTGLQPVSLSSYHSCTFILRDVTNSTRSDTGQ